MRMDIIKLSKAVIQICESNYSKNCGSCKLRPACTKHCGIGAEKLNHWVQKLNTLAMEPEAQNENKKNKRKSDLDQRDP